MKQIAVEWLLEHKAKKIAEQAKEMEKQTWDIIMAESGSWDDSEILAYIIKNYNPPTKKQDNDK